MQPHAQVTDICKEPRGFLLIGAFKDFPWLLEPRTFVINHHSFLSLHMESDVALVHFQFGLLIL